MRFALVLALVAACGRGDRARTASGDAASVVASRDAGVAVADAARAPSRADAVAAVEALVATQAEHWRTADPTGFANPFATDALTIITAYDSSASARVASSRELVDALQTYREAERYFPLEETVLRDVHVGATDAGAAWASFELHTVWHVDGDDQNFDVTHDFRVTELLDHDRDRGWQVVAAQLSLPVADRAAFARARAAAGAPERLPGAGGPAPLAALLADPAALAAQLLDDPAVVAIGSAPGERALGPEAVRRLAGRWSKVRFELVGEPRACPARGRVACAAANVLGRFSTRDGEVAVPFTATVFAVDGRVVAAHYGNE